MAKQRKTVVHVRIEPELVKKIDRMAEQDERDRSHMVAILLKRALVESQERQQQAV